MGNVTVLTRPKKDAPGEERTIHIVGTAHVSKKSVEEVRRVIHEVKPDTVCIELCPTRYEALTDEDRWKKLDVFQVIKQDKVLFLMASIALQSFQRRIGDRLGVKPGAELLAGAQAAEEIGAELVLVDRDVQATLRRTWANVGFFNKMKLVGGLFATMFGDDDEEISEEQIEALKDHDTFSAAMDELSNVIPEVRGPLIDERDLFLISAIENAPGDAVVAVVGAGHVKGMLEHVGEDVDRDALSVIPPPSKWIKVFKWIIPIIILSAFAYGGYNYEWKGLRHMLYAWLLPNSILAGIFTIIAGGKPLTVLTSIVASPITSLNPTIGAGMVAGLVEAWLRKPTVEDCEQFGNEVDSIKAAYGNPVARVLMVAVLASVGSSLGAYIGAAWVVKLLASGG